MSKESLVYKKRISSTLLNSYCDAIDLLAKKTKLAKTALIEEAVEDLFKKYNVTVGDNYRKDDENGKKLCRENTKI